MDAPTRAGEQKLTSFLEYHYYRGGLRTEYVALSGARPSWAPPAEWVGFRDVFSLAGSDLVLEVVRFRVSIGIAVWTGVYRHSPDQVYGDRQNHAGIGVWLLNQFPIKTEMLVESLEKLLDLVSESSKDDFLQKSQAYLRDYLGGYIAPLRRLPPPIDGMRLASNEVLTTTSFQIARHIDGWTRRLEDLLYRIFFLAPKSGDSDRALILLTGPNDREPGTRSNGIEEYTKESFASELLAAMPSAFKSQSQAVADLQKKIETNGSTISELDGRVDQLQHALTSERARVGAIQAQYDELKASLSEDDERRRFSVLHEAITSLHSQIATVNREISTSKRELMSEIRRDLHKALSSLAARAPNQPGKPEYGEPRGDSPRQQKSEAWQLDYIKLAAIILLVAGLLGLMGYIVYRISLG